MKMTNQALGVNRNEKGAVCYLGKVDSKQLSRQGSLGASVLEPEKLNQQEDFLDDVVEDDEAFEDENAEELSNEQIEKLRRESYSQMVRLYL